MADRRKIDINMNADFEKLASRIGQSFSETFEPLILDLKDEISESRKENEKIVDAIKNITIESPEVNIPEIRIPEIRVPEAKVTVNPQQINFPEMPKYPEMMKTTIEGVNFASPLPVILTGMDGSPYTAGSIISGGGGGGFRIVEISDIRGSSASLISDAEGALKVTGAFTVTGSASSTLVQLVNADNVYFDTANPLPVTVLSGGTATSASALVDSSGVQYSGSNPLPVTVTSGGTATSAVNLVDSTGVAYSGSNPVPVSGSVLVSDVTASLKAALIDSTGVQYSGSNPVPVAGTVAVSGVTNSIGATILNGEGIARDTWGSSQVGTWNIATLTGITNTVAAANIDSTGVQYSGSNPMPMTINALESKGLDVMTVRQVSGASDSVYVTGIFGSLATAMVDSGGVQYSGSNPVPVQLVANVASSTVAVGAVVADVADDGSAPVKQGGIARQANPTAVAAGDIVSATFDDVGRQVFRNMQVRDLIKTAYASVANGTEATLISGVAGSFLDLVQVVAANNSDAAATIDIRPVTAGNIVHTLQVPANGTAGWVAAVPYPQNDSGNNWTIDMNDITGTTVYVSALFSQEI